MSRWQIAQNGNAVVWDVAPGDLHTDDLEMAGFGCAHVVKYGVTEDGFLLTHHPVFPTLRLRPNNTHASYQMDIPEENIPHLIANGQSIRETLTRVRLDGTVTLWTEEESLGLSLTHRCFPSSCRRAAYEQVTVANKGTEPVSLTVSIGDNEVDQTMGPMGINILEVTTGFRPLTLKPGETYAYDIIITGRIANEEKEFGDPSEELRARIANIERLTSPMKLDTGNTVLDTMFRFAKLRAGESVFDTRYGLIHSPGGYSYYAATWCNDQVEYAGPYFAYTGDPDLIEASMNAYRMYRPFMSDRYKPIPSSVIAEGVDYWNGAGDRGDAAMYLYGASRFALTCGDPEIAEELLPGIEWCAEYCERKKIDCGVIASDHDELEGRFPSGKANLCTSTLAYAGLCAASALEKEIGSEALAICYADRAKALKEAIDAYFGHTIHDIPTYRYYEGCEVLRSWICMPLCVGIFDRAEATVRALCSDYLMKSEGLLTTEDNQTLWDRSTLYGLRGILASGFTEKGTELLLHYSQNRLLGERAPYAVEAYPEGGKRHLSGESALYCKVIVEGLVNLTPTGLHSFTVKPTLPAALDHCYLTDIRAHGCSFDIRMEKDGYRVIRSDGVLLGEGKNGEMLEIRV